MDNFKFLLIFLFVLCISLGISNAIPSLKAPEKVNEISVAETSFLTPIKKQIIKLSIMINREIPKRMKELKNNPSISVVVGSAFAAFLYGIVHTLGPGHGKMVVATYFLSHGAHFARGGWVGLQVTLSHVGGAVVIVLLTNITMKSIMTNPEAEVYWIRTVSYGLIIVIGLFMAVQALRKLLHKHDDVHSCGHCSKHSNHNHKKETFLSWCVGAVPCTGSLLILVYAMAYDVLWLGFFMVGCIAIGMAMTMMVIGLICISGKKHIIDKMSVKKEHSKIQPTIEFIGACFIIFIGSVLIHTVLNI